MFFVLYYGLYLVLGVFVGILTFFSVALKMPVLLIFTPILFLVLILGTLPGFIVGTLKAVDGQKPEFKDLFSHTDMILPILITAVVAGFISWLGMIFLILPGIYLAIVHMFAVYLVVDKKVSPMDSLKASREMVKGGLGSLIAFFVGSFLLIFIVALISSIIPFFNLIVVQAFAIIIQIAYAVIYRRWSGGTVTTATPSNPQPSPQVATQPQVAQPRVPESQQHIDAMQSKTTQTITQPVAPIPMPAAPMSASPTAVQMTNSSTTPTETQP